MNIYKNLLNCYSNKEVKGSIFSVGSGLEKSRKNAFCISKNGENSYYYNFLQNDGTEIRMKIVNGKWENITQ